MFKTKNILLMLEKAENESHYRDSLSEDSGYAITTVVKPTENLFLNAARHMPDLILIDVSTLSATQIEQLNLIRKEHAIAVVLFCRDASRESIERAITSGVNVYISSHVELSRLHTILDTAMIRFSDYQSLRLELEQTRMVLAERKLIEKAKGILMRKSHMDEQTTYKTMRKMSMDRNLKMSELSQTIIAAAELMN